MKRISVKTSKLGLVNFLAIPLICKKSNSFLIKKSLFFIIALLFTWCNSFAQREKKDVIYLKNGSIINGRIISYLPSGAVKIKTKDNSLWIFETAEVDSIRQKSKSIYQIKPGYFNLTEAGILAGNSNNRYKSPFSLMNISAWKFKNRFSAGLGAGIELVNETYFPVVADLRYYFKNQGLNPFIGLQGGYSFSLDKPGRLYSDPLINTYPGYMGNNQDLKGKGGGTFNPSIGICTMLTENLALTFGLGYLYMRQRYTGTNDYKIDIEYNRLTVKIGLLIQ